MDGARYTSSNSGMLGGAVNSPKSISMASISSEGSMESPLVEQEEIAALTHDVRNFKEALGKMRKIFHPDWADKEKSDSMRVAVHERLGEVLRILRSVLERYPALQSTELLVSAGTLIQQVKGYNYEGEHVDPKEFFECIDQLALAFSSRVSEYLMGDLDTNISLSSSISSKTKSCENLASDVNSGGLVTAAEDKKSDTLSPQQIDGMLLLMEQGVDFALQHAKLWSKYAKDLMMYVEKRAHLEMEYNKNLSKLAMTVRPLINEECHLPFQSIYCTALDHDMDNSNSCQITSNLLLGNKFLEPLSIQRAEHEKMRKQVKEMWHKELAIMHKVTANLQNSHSTYIKCQRDWEQIREETQRAAIFDSQAQGKLDRRRPTEDEAMQKSLEAEMAYKAAVVEANECHAHMLKVKSSILQSIRELILQSDQVIKTVTVAYFQLQHTLSTPLPTQFQTLYESSQLYDPGSQYLDFVKRLPIPLPSQKDPVHQPFIFEPYFKGTCKLLEQERKSTDSAESEDMYREKIKYNVKAGSFGSDTDSIASSQSNKSHEPSPTSSRKLIGISSCDELSANDNEGSYLRYGSGQRYAMSKAAETHTFRKLITPSRCRECDSYVYFHGIDCTECGLTCHKKCLGSLAIQCGHKRLPRKMTTFGVDLGQHLTETNTVVPHIITKCIDEIDSRGRSIKGIYRVSGVKSRVEKLCQAFENGADLVDLTDSHPNVIANVLKLYLRQLPEPLLTFCLYTDFIRIAKLSEEAGSELAAVEELKELVRNLPRHHYLTLAMLMQHLERVASEEAINSMPSSNLGIVFGPTLLRTPEGSASLSCLVDTVHQTRAIELMIKYAHEIFGLQDVVRAQESARIEMDLSSYKGIRKHSQTGEETTSDDELPYFLLSDDPTSNKNIPHEAMPKVFEGSLKDYQGLEGLSLLANQGASSESTETSQKVKKCTSTEAEKTVTTKVAMVSRGRERKLLNTQRTESSADSDYSFESHASSSVESRSPRELEESCDVFLELPQWCKRSQCGAPVAVMDSPSSSISQSPDDYENVATSQTSNLEKASTSNYCAYIPSSLLTSADMEMMLSRRTCFQTEKVMSEKYSGVKMEEKSSGKVTAPNSHHGSYHFSKASTVTTSMTKSPSKAEHTTITHMENVINAISSDNFTDA